MSATGEPEQSAPMVPVSAESLQVGWEARWAEMHRRLDEAVMPVARHYAGWMDEIVVQIPLTGTDTPAASAATGDERRDCIRAALRAYKSETEHYLGRYRSWPLTSPYNPECCGHCRTEHNRWENDEESRQLLQRRLGAINDTLAEYADA